jgi:hypothetical protein
MLEEAKVKQMCGFKSTEAVECEIAIGGTGIPASAESFCRVAGRRRDGS